MGVRRGDQPHVVSQQAGQGTGGSKEDGMDDGKTQHLVEGEMSGSAYLGSELEGVRRMGWVMGRRTWLRER